MYREHRDVVFLTEVTGSLRNRFGREAVGEQSPGTLEAVKFAFFAASFRHTVGVEGQAIAFPEDEFLILELGFVNDSQGKRLVERELVAVEEGREMAGVCQRAMAETVQLEQESRREAALHAAEEAAIESGENFRGFTLKLGESADCADDEGDVHRRLETFSADIADNDQRGSHMSREMIWKKSPPTSCAGW